MLWYLILVLLTFCAHEYHNISNNSGSVLCNILLNNASPMFYALIDFDVLCISNLERLVAFGCNRIGQRFGHMPIV